MLSNHTNPNIAAAAGEMVGYVEHELTQGLPVGLFPLQTLHNPLGRLYEFVAYGESLFFSTVMSDYDGRSMEIRVLAVTHPNGHLVSRAEAIHRHSDNAGF